MSTPVRILLDWHRRRRGCGTPTVTVLAGPVNLAVRAWRGWVGPRPASVVRVPPDLGNLTVAWAGDALSSSPGPDYARAWVARVTNRDLAAVARGTDRVTGCDLERVWRSLPSDPAAPVARAACLVLAA